MLTQRLRRWSNIKTTLGQHLVFAGMCIIRIQGALQTLDVQPILV